MIEKQEFFYDSADNKTKIHYLKWTPKAVKIKAVLQISHGMLEHIKRYDDFACYMAEKGILVVGNDHLGHGDSVLNEECRGYFCESDGNKTVLQDINKLKNIIKNEYPHIPYFILGHSMGSYLLRQYITIYGNDLQGAIIMGTGNQPFGLVKSG
ncbi:MAG: Alpha/beta hydrolase, N-terminal protein, partial [Bacillota bacterium]|nr:Alpha/beta hydrolase, N-terminal protein [Bacillota bacterium]